jgi:hypothetical protein
MTPPPSAPGVWLNAHLPAAVQSLAVALAVTALFAARTLAPGCTA